MQSKFLITGICAVFVTGVLCVACANQQSTDTENSAQDQLSSQTTTENLDLSDMQNWEDACPLEFETYLAGAKATYSTAGKTGKINAIADAINSTEETNGPFQTRCLVCHSTEYDLAMAKGDTKYFDMSEKKVIKTLGKSEYSISCQSCHLDTSGTLAAACTWVADAANTGGIEIDDKTFVCAQCHSLMSFENILSSSDTSTWSSMAAGTDPDAVYDWFLAQGQSAPHMASYQYNCFEGSTHDLAGASCATCHMEKKTGDNGETYTSMIWQTVRDNANLYNKCLSCHTSSSAADRETALNAYQASFEEKTSDAQAGIDKLTDAIAKAKKVKKTKHLSDKILTDAQANLDKANFYLAYIAGDSSKGYHVMGKDSVIDHCLETSLSASSAGLEALS